MNTISGRSVRPPRCPSCAQPMRLARTTERFGDLPSLRTFECRACGIAFTRETEANPVAHLSTLRPAKALFADQDEQRDLRK